MPNDNILLLLTASLLLLTSFGLLRSVRRVRRIRAKERARLERMQADVAAMTERISELERKP